MSTISERSNWKLGLTEQKWFLERLWYYMRCQLFSISEQQASFARRGFRGSNLQARQQLEESGRSFLRGYQIAIEEERVPTIFPKLEAIASPWRGFAYEGAAMGLTLLDWLIPWRRSKIQEFLEGVGQDHIYMVYVGMGWAWARLPLSIERALERLDPLLGWLAIDGYGFHQGYFYWNKYICQQLLPRRITGYGTRVFDRGLGRSLWFVEGAEVSNVVKAISSFESNRRGDLWSGIGLACAYAGGVEKEALEHLKKVAGIYLPELRQGVVFAAKARLRAKNVVEHTEMACRILCDLSALAAAEISDRVLENLLPQGNLNTYEIWRQRILESQALRLGE
jgi:hypothetical protein